MALITSERVLDGIRSGERGVQQRVIDRLATLGEYQRREVADFLRLRVKYNTDGLAEKLGAKLAKRLRRDKPVRYVVPTWLTKALNILERADAAGVALLDPGGTPRSRSAIVKHTREARRNREIAALTGIEKTEQEVQNRLRDLSVLVRDRMRNWDEPTVNAMYTAINGLASSFEGLIGPRDEAD